MFQLCLQWSKRREIIGDWNARRCSNATRTRLYVFVVSMETDRNYRVNIDRTWLSCLLRNQQTECLLIRRAPWSRHGVAGLPVRCFDTPDGLRHEHTLLTYRHLPALHILIYLTLCLSDQFKSKAGVIFTLYFHCNRLQVVDVQCVGLYANVTSCAWYLLIQLKLVERMYIETSHNIHEHTCIFMYTQLRTRDQPTFSGSPT